MSPAGEVSCKAVAERTTETRAFSRLFELLFSAITTISTKRQAFQTFAYKRGYLHQTWGNRNRQS